ncbi:MAG TPA: type II secretion system protein [Candidatus Paceibacterota bacterium]|nr:type II secretion system protein [Candidatus Paceibacterota bacterium]
MNKGGFTLIEIMVSVTIFSIVMVVSMGALLSISAADKKAETLKTVMNNLNFAIESMSRTIRTGTLYDCGRGANTDCTDGAQEVGFHPVDAASPGARTKYKFETTAAPCGQSALATAGCIMRDTGDGSGYLSITAPEVVITSLKFYLVGSSPADTLQARITIALSGFVKISGNPASMADCLATPAQCSVFNIQTSVTQRLYDQ